MHTSERFPQTRCSIIEQLGSNDDQARNAAYDVLVRAYWQPVYAYLRLRWQLEPADAEDATQGFLTAAWSKGYFESFDAEQARFRTFLRVCLDRFVRNQLKSAQAQKRGGTTEKLSLDFAGLEGSLAVEDPALITDPNEFFRREYVRALFARAVDRLRSELLGRGRQIVFDVFSAYDLAGADASYNGVAAQFSLPVTQVTNHLHAARRRFRELVLAEIRATSSNEAEYRAEAREILGFELP